MKQVINRKLYDTEKANTVATDIYWDGHNWDRKGRNRSLMKTKNGNFFVFHQTCWQGERDYIEPVSVEEAKDYYEELPEQEMSYRDAFGEEPEEA